MRPPIPVVVRESGLMPDPDWTFVHSLPRRPGDDRDALAWARSFFEGAPAPLRWIVVSGWRVALRLQLAPLDSADHVLGWSVVRATPELAALGVGSPLLTPRLVVSLAGDDTHGTVTHTTLLRFDRPLGRVLWLAAGPIHRLVVAYLLRRAARAGRPG